MNGGSSGGGGGGSWPFSSSLTSSDMIGINLNNGVRASGLSGFLTKTYNLVNDPNINAFVSWGKHGNSFIIWDHIRFAKEILPKYFRHDNLASFVYQLNNYGFRKIGVEHQWEYENPDFQAGKLHLLMNIKRRSQKPETATRRQRPKQALAHSHTMISPAHILRNDINEMKLEIEKLKRQQQDMKINLMALEKEVKNAEIKALKLKKFFAKIIISTGEVGKKRKLDNNREEIGKDLKNDGDDEDEELVKEDTTRVYEKQLTNDSAGSLVVDNDDHEEPNANTGAMLEKNSSGDYAFWKKILMENNDDHDCELVEAGTGDDDDQMANKQAKISLDLEDFITKMAHQDNK